MVWKDEWGDLVLLNVIMFGMMIAFFIENFVHIGFSRNTDINFNIYLIQSYISLYLWMLIILWLSVIQTKLRVIWKIFILRRTDIVILMRFLEGLICSCWFDWFKFWFYPVLHNWEYGVMSDSVECRATFAILVMVRCIGIFATALALPIIYLSTCWNFHHSIRNVLESRIVHKIKNWVWLIISKY